MHADRTPELYPVRFDERREAWYLDLADTPRVPIDRATLTHLVSLYNEIHYGQPLTLIQRRVMEELGQERHDLRETVTSLYDYLDEQDPLPAAPAAAAAPLPTGGLLARLGQQLVKILERIPVR